MRAGAQLSFFLVIQSRAHMPLAFSVGLQLNLSETHPEMYFHGDFSIISRQEELTCHREQESTSTLL